ncbi:DNA polymerase III subunit delta', partial [Rhodobaculum claviforme]|nr:DNA polymerase III subunit delta' [Rhodobaculum claviforme]
MSAGDIPEADRIDGVPHPRHTAQLFGQHAAEADFRAALAGGRLHHGWLLTGPRGVGKATLAWRLARALLAFGTGATTLDVPADHPVARRMAALSEGRLLLLRRAWDPEKKRLPARIGVDEARRLQEFLTLSAADGGWRAVIVDAADDLTPEAANALLKLLEEPPPRTVLFLVCHRPAALLPTIRSRCRPLALAPLGAGDMGRALDQAGVAVEDTAAVAELAHGSVGAAVGLVTLEGTALYARLVGLLSGLPRVDRTGLLAVAQAMGGRGAEDRRDLVFDLLGQWLMRAARTGAGHPPPAEAAPNEAALCA